jgi:hypothetical protein
LKKKPANGSQPGRYADVHAKPLIFAALCQAACLPEPPNVDLEGPRIVAASLVGPRSVDVPVLPELALEFSEPIDPASVHPGSVALLEWELLEDRCDLTPLCTEGSCDRGRCQTQSLGAGERSDLERGEFDASVPHAVALAFELVDGAGGLGSQLLVRPLGPLDAHRRYSLVIGPGVRDHSGAPLVDDFDRAVAWQRDFVTAGIGSSGPEPILLTPAPGQLGVATNLARVEMQLWPPVPVPQPEATLLLEADDGSAPIVLLEPLDCTGWVPGTCLGWRPASPLQPGVRYRPAGGTLVDRFGRFAVRPGATRETWFGSSSGPDLDPPHAELVEQLHGRCLALWIDAGEPVEAVLQVDALARRGAIDHAGFVGLELSGPAPGDTIAWTLQLRDLAGNTIMLDGQLVAGPSFDPELPHLRITEVLANPSGPEPDGEFVELLAGPDGAELDGVFLSDLSFTDISAALAMGDDPPGDPLPPASLGPGELAIVVGNGWSGPGGATGQAQVLVLGSSLAGGGLKNAGEPVTVWMPSEHGPIELARYGNWIETGASSHDGRSVIAGLDACDLPDRWRSHPQGLASPGSFP